MEAVYRQARDQLGLRPRGIYLLLRDRWWRISSSYAPYSVAALLTIVTGLALIWVWQTHAPGQTHTTGQRIPSLTEELAIIGSLMGVITTIFAFGHNYQIGSVKTAKSYLELARDPLSPLTKHYGDLIADIGRPVAVFVDDLDRCNSNFVVELLQTIQTLFRNARVLYVVAADRDWVCASYQQQYTLFGNSLGEPGKSLGHLFIEKVFQLSVEVPRLNHAERDDYWDRLINSRLPSHLAETQEANKEITRELDYAQTEADVIKVIERYRDDPIRGPVAAAKGFQRMLSAPLTKEREHFLAGYKDLVESNPRAMKRLINAYGFRRGFDIQARQKSDPDALVRWTILENRWPILAD